MGVIMRKRFCMALMRGGDNRLDSDIDIMILVKCDDDMIHQYMRAVRDYTYDINEKYDSEIMPIVKNAEHFKIWIPNYPFYNNVAKEGIEINV